MAHASRVSDHTIATHADGEVPGSAKPSFSSPRRDLLPAQQARAAARPRAPGSSFTREVYSAAGERPPRAQAAGRGLSFSNALRAHGRGLRRTRRGSRAAPARPHERQALAFRAIRVRVTLPSSAPPGCLPSCNSACSRAGSSRRCCSTPPDARDRRGDVASEQAAQDGAGVERDGRGQQGVVVGGGVVRRDRAHRQAAKQPAPERTGTDERRAPRGGAEVRADNGPGDEAGGRGDPGKPSPP